MFTSGGCKRSKAAPLRLTGREPAPGRERDSPVSGDSGQWRLPIVTLFAFRLKAKLRILLLTAGGLAPHHLIGPLVFSQPDINCVTQ